MKFLIISLIIACYVASPAMAKTPKCGELNRRDIEDTFDSAHDVRYYYDVRPDLNAACSALESFEEWEGSRDRDVISDKKYKLARIGAVNKIKDNIVSMRGALISLRIWKRLDPKGDIEKARRISQIREARKIIDERVQGVKDGHAQIGRLMRGEY